MKKKLTVLLTFCLSVNMFSQPKLIFDTDFGGDADDLGALAMLHHFIDRKECELLAIMSWSTEKYTVSAIDAVNRFYKHPDIPIGARKGDVDYRDWNYNKPITDYLPFELTYNDGPDATCLYRKILSENADASIIIVTVGPLANIKNLIESQPDSLSEYNGKELIEKKVKKFVIMGGQFPEGMKEWNFDGNMQGVTKFVIQNINVPIIFTGYEVGVDIKTGQSLNRLDKKSPLYIGFMYFSQNAPWMKADFKGNILNNSSYDQTAVLYAVRNGDGVYWDRIGGGKCIPDDFGGNKWVKSENSNHFYLKLKMDNKKAGRLIESLMLGEF
ncbi:MAG: nucleoside hydrolase [Candidatus Marinimicrobia bacterium]|nr:nucleoside hydrolase [Candidatus Neomarinimicrobiota bacterium]